MQSSSSSRALYKVPDVNYTSLGETPPVRQLPTDAKECLIALKAGSEAKKNYGDTRYLTSFFLLEHPVLLTVSDELGDGNFAGARYGAILNETKTAADGSNHAVTRGEKLCCTRRLIEHLRDGDHGLVRD